VIPLFAGLPANPLAIPENRMPRLPATLLIQCITATTEETSGSDLVSLHGQVMAQPRHDLSGAGALCAPSLVRLMELADGQQCRLPETSTVWPGVSLSCFQYEHHVVPILNTGRIFAQPVPSLLPSVVKIAPLLVRQ
jgi:hypothetical protein